MSKYILGIDQGTTGSTAVLVDKNLQVKAKVGVEFPQHFPKPSWVEHDLGEIWVSVCDAVNGVMKKAGASPSDVVSIGITNQRETTCLWERKPDAPQVCRAIVWQDRRTSAECQKLKKQGLERTINRRTGLLLDPYFSGTKLAWMLKNVSGASRAAKDGKIAFGTVDSYLLYRMTGEHATDVSNASRTMLMNIKSLKWDKDQLKLLKVPESILPEIKPSAVEYGRTRGFLDFPDGIPVAGIAGDQQAALFGQGCFRKGSAKCTYGTGAFVLVNTGSQPVFSKHKLLTTVAWQLGNEVTYAVEGSAFIAGASVQWLRDGLNLIDASAEVEALAASVEDSDGVVFVPGFTGLGAPHWLADATGLVTGLTRRTTKAHLARATLEGIAFQVKELLEAMGKDLGKKPSPLKVDGGASANNLLMQFQSDILGVKVARPKVLETTALGSTIQAGLAVGFWSGIKEVEKLLSSEALDKTFTSTMSTKERNLRVESWEKAIKAVKLLAKG